MQIDLFDFVLPKELIAQYPKRGFSRLLHLKKSGTIIDKEFKDIIDIVSADDVLVFNDTKVIPALINVIKINDLPVKMTINLIKDLDDGVWQILARPAKKINQNDTLILESKSGEHLKVVVTMKSENAINIKGEDILEFAIKNGQMPLPQYIKRSETDVRDSDQYQTVYAENYGAVAAPTAGLHFTKELMAALEKKGVKFAFTTLHVGLGTFAPIKVENIVDHVMHSEFYNISAQACDVINKAKAYGSNIICVGTTSMRVLESASNSGVLMPSTGETNLFIRPGYNFKIATGLITNFHLPKSTLYILVSAFSSINNIKKAYNHAIRNEYRFFSYGDACYLEIVDR
jgi:S-adenosylmethionine:tRNA ribosyltransferase-isomerase